MHKNCRRVEMGINSLSFGNSSWDPGHNFSLISHSAFRTTINILYFSSQVSQGKLHSTFSSRKTRFPCIATIKHFAAELSQTVNHTAAFTETQPIRRTPRYKLKVKTLVMGKPLTGTHPGIHFATSKSCHSWIDSS